MANGAEAADDKASNIEHLLPHSSVVSTLVVVVLVAAAIIVPSLLPAVYDALNEHNTSQVTCVAFFSSSSSNAFLALVHASPPTAGCSIDDGGADGVGAATALSP